MENTGERMVPEFHKNDFIYSEHWGRYLFAAQFIKDKIILDVACGSGYGSNYLAKRGAKKVIGLDYSKEAVDYAQENFSYKNLKFIFGDAHELPFKDAYFDIIVGFEMIEHLIDPRRFFKEVKRVLKKDGIFLISTPNEENYPEGNHFHVREFLEEDLKNLFAEYFKFDKFFYQKHIASAVIIDDNTMPKEDFVDPISIRTHKLSSFNTSQAEYFLILASDNKSAFEKQIHMEGTLFGEFPIERYRFLENSANKLGERNKYLEETLDSIYNSKSWALANSLRKIFRFRKLLPLLKKN